MKRTNFTYLVKIIELGDPELTKDYIASNFGKSGLFFLRHYPKFCEISHISKENLLDIMSNLETLNNKIVVTETESVTLFYKNMIAGSKGESKIIYTTQKGFINFFRTAIDETELILATSNNKNKNEKSLR